MELPKGIPAAIEHVSSAAIPGRFAFRQNNHFTPVTEQEIKWMSHHLYVCYANSLPVKKSFVVLGCVA
ncbi:MAG: hypothetical protein ACK5DG_02660 [Chitinophagaceae bacterium]